MMRKPVLHRDARIVGVPANPSRDCSGRTPVFRLG